MTNVDASSVDAGDIRVLVACEYSGVVREAFKKVGCYAMSCDLESTDIPGNHYQGDIFDIIGDGWDLMIGHPPCTHLSIAGNHLWKEKQQDGRQQAAFQFIMDLWDAPIDKICIENPVGWMNTNWMKPTQIIEPFQFGQPYKKRTCIWLKNLPKLEPTKIVEPTTYWVNASSNYRKGAKLSNKGLHRNPKKRSRSFDGIADAMAEQWSNHLIASIKGGEADKRGRVTLKEGIP